MKANSSPRSSRGSRSRRSHLLQPLDPRLGLARLGGLVAEALDEAFGALDLGLLGGDRPPQRQLVGRLFAAPVVPAAGEEAGSPGLQLEHGRADRLQEPAVVGHQHDRRVEPGEGLLEPFEGRDVEVVGGLVEQQHVCPGGQRPCQRRPRQLAAGEGVQRAAQVLVAEAEPVGGVARPVAPQVAATRLQLRLRRGVTGQCGLVPGAAGHRLLELGQLALDRQLLGAARQQVVLQGAAPLARRTLVVQRDPHALGDAQLAAVDRALPREHPQQGRLAGAVASGQREPFATLELEGDAAQQRLPGDVLAQIRCCQEGHRELMVRADRIRPDRPGSGLR